jgi:Smg protein
MFEILMFLFESYFDAGSYPDSDKLSLKLTAAGFEDEEINLALAWLSGLKRLNATDYPDSINHVGTRCFAELETKRISIEGLHFLTFWEQSNVISPAEREMIIDRAVALERENLSLNKVKLIALMVLWNLHHELDPLLVEELLAPGDASLLH